MRKIQAVRKWVFEPSRGIFAGRCRWDINDISALYSEKQLCDCRNFLCGGYRSEKSPYTWIISSTSPLQITNLRIWMGSFAESWVPLNGVPHKHQHGEWGRNCNLLSKIWRNLQNKKVFWDVGTGLGKNDRSVHLTQVIWEKALWETATFVIVFELWLQFF